MRFDTLAMLGAASVFLAAPASFAATRFQGSGQVTGVTGFGVPATGSITVGQTLAFDFTFDAAGAVRIFDGGTNQQSFGLPATVTGVTIGGFTLAPTTFVNGPPAVVVLGTGFRPFPGEPSSQAVLNQAFFIPGLPSGNLPFATGSAGRVQFGLISTFRQDLGGAVPTLANLADPAQAAINQFQLTVNDGSRTIGLVTGTFSGSFAAAVPEPETWALLILGFGAIGSTMRTRRRALRELPA